MISNTLLANTPEKISFEISFKEPQAHYAEIKMEIIGNKDNTIDVKMPVWAPGSYLIREFPKNVEGFHASSEGKELKSTKVNKNTWRIQAGNAKNIEINYRVYAFEVSVRTSFIDASHAFLSSTGIFMYLDKKIDYPTEVKIIPHSSWKKISTGLEKVPGKKNTFYAPNFDVLFDSPIEVGNQDVFHFKAAGVDHEVAMVGGGNYNKETLIRDIAKIIESETTVFGENPNKKYVFIIHNYESGGGGLEHLNSTVLGASRNGYTNNTSYLNFLGLVSHEYFHIWNVKRLRPENLGPFNYDAENYTTNLWISEGFTAYYDNLILRRAGLIDEAAYLRILADDINAVENRPGNTVQTLKESSFDAWIKQYRPNENSINTTVTYYNKGALIALLLDLKILHATNTKKGLDAVMKAMYDQYYKKEDRGFTEGEFVAMAEEIAGISLKEVFNYVDSAKSIDYNSYLEYAGLELIDVAQDLELHDLGVKTSNQNGKLIVTNVISGSGAWNDGINAKDELISINNVRINTTEDLDNFLKSAKPGDQYQVLISRDGILKTLDVTLTPNKTKRYFIMPLEEVTKEQIAVRKAWLNL
jgi:predicted metalloprotease with PDZ domain